MLYTASRIIFLQNKYDFLLVKLKEKALLLYPLLFNLI